MKKMHWAARVVGSVGLLITSVYQLRQHCQREVWPVRHDSFKHPERPRLIRQPSSNLSAHRSGSRVMAVALVNHSLCHDRAKAPTCPAHLEAPLLKTRTELWVSPRKNRQPFLFFLHLLLENNLFSCSQLDSEGRKEATAVVCLYFSCYFCSFSIKPSAQVCVAVVIPFIDPSIQFLHDYYCHGLSPLSLVLTHPSSLFSFASFWLVPTKKNHICFFFCFDRLPFSGRYYYYKYYYYSLPLFIALPLFFLVRTCFYALGQV